MKPKEMKAFKTALRFAVRYVADTYTGQFPTPQEKAFETLILRKTNLRNVEFFHGGVGGLEVGDVLVAGSVIGTTHNGFAPHEYVFLTSSLDTARTYATALDGSNVYRVRPIGPVGIDILCVRTIWAMARKTRFPILSRTNALSWVTNQFTCKEAEIVEVLE